MITQLNSFGITDIGCHRAANEDRYLLSELHQPIVANASHPTDCDSLVTKQAVLLAVADGLGGHQGGGIASELAVDSLGCFAQENEIRILNSTAAWKLANLLREGILKADARIETLAANHSTRHGMATTLTAAIIRYPDLVIGHVGDSRCYMFRDGELTRLTKDHTMAELYRNHEQATDSAASSDSQSEASPMSHVLWNCLGGRTGTDIESHVVTLKPDDWILLATDGLYRHVSDSEIQQALANAENPRQLCTDLKQLAIERGGKDNITIVACNWENQTVENPRLHATTAKAMPTRGVYRAEEFLHTLWPKQVSSF